MKYKGEKMARSPKYHTAKILATSAEVLGWLLNIAGVVFASRALQHALNLQSVGVLVAAFSIGFGLILSAQIIKAQVHTAENTARLVELFERWAPTKPEKSMPLQSRNPTTDPAPDARTEPSLRR